MASATAAAAGDAPSASLSPASDRLRATVNWLIASLGAVAVAVIGGVSLASLGDVAPSTDPVAFGVAIAGAAVAVTAALGALVAAASITARSTVTITDLTRFPAQGWRGEVLVELAGQPAAAAWRAQNFSAASAMIRAYLDAVHDYDTKYLDHLTPRTAVTDEELDAAGARLAHLQNHFAQLMSAASYLRLRAAFRSSLLTIACLVLFVIAGALTFSFAISTLKNEPAPATLTPATWSVPDPIRSIVSSRLGGDCGYDLDQVPVMIVGVGDAGERRIITLDTPTCAAVELSATADRLVEG